MSAPDESASKPGRKRWLSAGAYSVGAMAQRAIGLLMLPVYTRAISADEYGALGLLVSIGTAVQILFTLGMDPYIVRSYFQMASDREARDHALQSIWRFTIAYPLIASLVGSAVAWPLLAGNDLIHGFELFLTFLSAALSASASTVPLAILRARQQLRGYLAVSAMFGLLTPAVTVVFVVVLDQGVRGWFLAAVIANAAALAVAMKVIPWNPRARFEKTAVRAAVVFSLPLLPHFISHWALQLADRVVLSDLVSAGRLGVYTLASNMAAPAMMLVVALNQAFAPTYARAGVGEGIGDELTRTVVTQIQTVVFITLAVAVVGPPAVTILTPPEYHDAGELMPLLALGFGFLGVYFVPMNGAALAAGRRAFAWVASVGSAGANIGLVYLLTPAFGLTGAAAASALGYLVLLVLIAVWARSGANPVRYDWRRILPPIVASVLVFVAASATHPDSPVADLAVSIAWIGLFAALLFGTRLVRGGLLPWTSPTRDADSDSEARPR